MAQLKWMAAIVVALCAVVLEAEAGKGLLNIVEQLETQMKRNLTSKEQQDAQTVFSFAQEYVNKLEASDKPTGEELLSAWDRVLHEPDQCDELSLEYIKTLYQSMLSSIPFTPALPGATRKYARKCLTPTYVANRTESQVSDYSSESSFKTITEFIDDQFIADYWSDHAQDRPLKHIWATKATRAMANAILRDSENNITDLEDSRQVQTYLEEHLSEPCSEYSRTFDKLIRQVYLASDYLESGRQ